MAGSKLTPLAMAVLELLHEKPMHPYEMAQLMRERHMGLRIPVKAGSLYHTVERLEGQRLIEVVTVQREGRRPERTVYGMTQAGKDAFVERGKAMLSTVADEYPEFACGLSVLDDLDPDEVLVELRNRALRLAAGVASDDVITGHLRERELPEIYWLDWKFYAERRRFELDWTNRLVAEIESGELAWQHAGRDHPRGLSLVTDERRDGDEHEAS
ncbi:PadR family transcriptional regulator [Amycolatopsis nigrescens]|uniref:PadR family transcriptional regulator n=1 Tax=Amycolatopsis nigrescens TaxID=381445 RepID=UPI00036392C0|nr:PadR family transcriptional regulator [Amycolatopsis nigrescens]